MKYSSCEELSKYIGDKIRDALAKEINIEYIKVQVGETPYQFATRTVPHKLWFFTIKENAYVKINWLIILLNLKTSQHLNINVYN